MAAQPGVQLSEVKGEVKAAAVGAMTVSDLLEAAKRNNLVAIRAYADQGGDVRAVNQDRRTAMHIACSDGQLDAVQELVRLGADVNLTDRFGFTPLDNAVLESHPEIAAFLKARGAKFGSVAKLEAALFKAAQVNDIKQVQQLLQNKPDLVRARDFDGRSPLHIAVNENHVEVAKALLEAKADAHATDRFRRTPQEEALKRLVDDPNDAMASLFQDSREDAESHKLKFGGFMLFMVIWEILMILFWFLFVKYSDHTGGGTDPADSQTVFNGKYPSFQDVHIMIFIGFAFLMVFLRRNGFNAIGMTFLIGALSIQWYILIERFWHSSFHSEWLKVSLDVTHFIRGDFAAGAVLISYGVLLGKVSALQIVFMTIWEVLFFALNETIGLKMEIADIGGSVTIHMFGAFFGLACAWAMRKTTHSKDKPDCASVYHSDVLAMIGTIFLWAFWPSFNSCLASGNQQHRAVINTVTSLAGSCVCAFISSYFFRREKQFNMVDIQNATLAGGVAVGMSADMLIQPGAALIIGCLAGTISVLGYVYVTPALEKIGLHDTCGVNNLHGMPSLLGALAGTIATAAAKESDYGDQLGNVFVGRPGFSASKQASIQVGYWFCTLGIAILSGTLAGIIMSNGALKPPQPQHSFQDKGQWEVPASETPYYFDARGEISRPVKLPTSTAEQHLLQAHQAMEERLEILEGRLATKQYADVSKLENVFDLLLRRANGNAAAQPAVQ